MSANNPPVPEPLQRLRLAVEQANYQLVAATYNEARRLFTACTSDRELLGSVQTLAPEYGRSEFLRCVNGQGASLPVDQNIVADFQESAAQLSQFRTWFQVADQADRSILLVARWLCHLVGFRHRAVHLFIDHPNLEEYTLVQVRGMQKHAFPGCFDAPAAGHVVGLESALEALFKELCEELDLGRDDLHDLETIGSYAYCSSQDDPRWRNVEFREVFVARLSQDGLAKIGFADREVAAVGIFELTQLKALVDAFPERVASGLKKSLPLYLKRGNTRC